MSIRSDYDQVFRSLSRAELQDGDEPLRLNELFEENRWLGFYTESGLRTAMERYGLTGQLRELGYEALRLELRADDPQEQLLRIWSEDPKLDSAPLLELVARRDELRLTSELSHRFALKTVPVLNIGWLQLQRPDAPFTAQRPPLPGQRYPGLGLGREVLEMLRQSAKRLGLHGLATVPSYFHNAYFYSVEFQYVDPQEQGLFLALCRDLLPSTEGSVGAASWAIAEQMVSEGGEPFDWFHDVMVAPISDELVAYMDADAYHAESGEALRKHRLEVFEAALQRHLTSKGIAPLEPSRIAQWIDDVPA